LAESRSSPGRDGRFQARMQEAFVSTLATEATEDAAWERAARLRRHSRCFVKPS